MLLCRVPPKDACNPPAPNGKLVSEFEKKNRAPILSLLELNSLSQFVVNWSSVYFPGLLTRSGPVNPAVPAIEGIRKPLGSLKRLFLPLKFKSFRTSGSIAGGRISEERLGNGGFRPVRRNHRETRVVNRCSGRKRAALPCSLVVHEEISELLLQPPDRQRLLRRDLVYRRPRLARRIVKVFVGVQRIVSEELVNVTVQFP